MRAFLDRARRILFDASFYLVLIIGAYITVFNVGPYAETALWPVVKDFRVLAEHELADGRVSLDQVEFSKARNCEYIGISWYRGSRGGVFERVPVETRRRTGDDSSPNRPLGRQRTGPWIIALPSLEELKGNSFAELQHRCQPLWITTTRLYP